MSTEKNPSGDVWGRTMTKRTGVVRFATLNQGAPNEHLIVIQQFNKPGTYSYSTTDNPTLSPADAESFNRGINLTAQMIATVPVIVPGAQAVGMVPKPQEEKQNI